MADLDDLYQALRSAVGEGGSAEQDATTIDGLWRLCRARAIASVASFGERAATQAFPDRATDLLPYYERLLRPIATGETDDERREAAALSYALQIASSVRDIAIALRAIDPRFNVTATLPAQSDTTLFGRAFEGLDGSLPFGGGRKSTRYPNYSTEFILFVVLDLGGGVQPTTVDRRLMASAAQLLNNVLPAFNDWQIVTHRGFTLDIDRLDLTALGA
jgi:hypothetical protein